MAMLDGLKTVLGRQTLPPDGQMELMEHLAELRTRIFRSLLYVAVAMGLTYYQVPRLFNLLKAPLANLMGPLDLNIGFLSLQQGFFLWMQMCFVSGLVLATPFVVLEIWGFIAPALTDEERKPVKYLAPFSVLLFLAGVGIGYACLPTTYAWMATYLDDFGSVTVIQDATPFVLLSVKIMLAFGLAFQLPIVLLFLARVGIVSANLMTTYWRHAVVAIAALSGILTPSNDPPTMLMMAVPMAGLYILSIGLVRAFEPKADGRRGPSLGVMLAVALAPCAMLGAVAFWLTRPAMQKMHVAVREQKPQRAQIQEGPAQNLPVDATSPQALRRDIDALKAQTAQMGQNGQGNRNGQSATPLPNTLTEIQTKLDEVIQRLEALENRVKETNPPASAPTEPTQTPSAPNDLAPAPTVAPAVSAGGRQ
jgi:sec-independent protein translocase protein TatC